MSLRIWWSTMTSGPSSSRSSCLRACPVPLEWGHALEISLRVAHVPDGETVPLRALASIPAKAGPWNRSESGPRSPAGGLVKASGRQCNVHLASERVPPSERDTLAHPVMIRCNRDTLGKIHAAHVIGRNGCRLYANTEGPHRKPAQTGL